MLILFYENKMGNKSIFQIDKEKKKLNHVKSWIKGKNYGKYDSFYELFKYKNYETVQNLIKCNFDFSTRGGLQDRTTHL